MKPSPEKGVNKPLNLAPPVGGINADRFLMGMKPSEAVAMENFFPYPDRIETRPGFVSHATALAEIPYALHVYSSNAGVQTLFATCDDGLFDVTAGGVVGAAEIAITNGKAISSMIATGAGHYMFVANGTDTLKRFDGTTWSSIATLGAVATETLNYVETYRQRLFFIVKNSLDIAYLPVNSISGSLTTYSLGAIFRRGGYLAAMATWTVDGGSGPDDYLVVMSSEGELAVFTGNDPTYVATWNLNGVYYLGRPLGKVPLFKYGGDLLILCEEGVIPLSKKLQSTVLEKTEAISENIRPLINEAARSYSASDGWQIIYQPDYPFILVNVPSFPLRKQYVMNAQTGAWTTFTGWEAYAFARIGKELYFSTETSVCRVTGTSDDGDNITASLLQAYSRLGSPMTKQIKLVKPYLAAGGAVTYTMGLAQDFSEIAEYTNPVIGVNVSLSLWGTGIWGTALWGTSEPETIQNWYTLPDGYSSWKAFYLEVSASTTLVSYFGSDALATVGGNF